MNRKEMNRKEKGERQRTSRPIAEHERHIAPRAQVRVLGVGLYLPRRRALVVRRHVVAESTSTKLSYHNVSREYYSREGIL